MGKVVRVPNLRANSGSAILMTLVIAVVLAGIIEFGAMSYLQSKSQTIDNRVFASYASLSDHLKNSSVMFWNNGSFTPLAATLRTSLNLGTANPELANCIVGSIIASCQSGVAKPLTLYFPILQSGTQPLMAGPGPYGSAESSPARYDVYGNPCSSATWTARCPFEVYAQFTPSCGGPPVCSRAVSVSVNFQLRGPHGGYSLVSGNQTGQNLPLSDIVSSAIDVTAVIPPTPSQIAQNSGGNVQVQGFGGGTPGDIPATPISTANLNPGLVAGLASVDPSVQAPLIDALNNSGITDSTILQALAVAYVASTADAQAIAAAIQTAGITDPAMIGVLAVAWIENAAQASQVVAELAAAGISPTNNNQTTILGDLISNGVTDPATLLAMYNALSSSSLSWISHDGVLAVVHAGSTDPTQIMASYNQGLAAAELAAPTEEESSTSSGSTASSSSSGSAGSSGSGSVTVPPPLPASITMINTCSGSQCVNPSF